MHLMSNSPHIPHHRLDTCKFGQMKFAQIWQHSKEEAAIVGNSSLNDRPNRRWLWIGFSENHSDSKLKLVGVFWDLKERKGSEVPLEFVWHVLCLQFYPQISAKVYMHPVKIVCLKCSQHKPAMCVYLTLNEAKDFIRKKNCQKKSADSYVVGAKEFIGEIN